MANSSTNLGSIYGDWTSTAGDTSKYFDQGSVKSGTLGSPVSSPAPAPTVPTTSTSSPTTGSGKTAATTLTGEGKTVSGQNTSSDGNQSYAESPTPIKFGALKSKILAPAFTSHFRCSFKPHPNVTTWLQQRSMSYAGNSNMQELISISCSEASLPGSSLITNEITDDYHGVTERHAYRRQYDDRADFTFYVDFNSHAGNSYNIIWFFEQWMAYIADEQYNDQKRPSISDSRKYFYRFKFPKNYQSDFYIQKFEKQHATASVNERSSYAGTYLEYRFLQAFPISINSMPISYDSSQLLKCTVSFSYARYIITRRTHGFAGNTGETTSSGGAPKTAPGTPNPAAASQPAANQQQVIENGPNDFLNLGNSALDQFGVRDQLGRGAGGTVGANILA